MPKQKVFRELPKQGVFRDAKNGVRIETDRIAIIGRQLSAFLKSL